MTCGVVSLRSGLEGFAFGLVGFVRVRGALTYLLVFRPYIDSVTL